jgi:RimJ/RimL family protein N-acetyltransferase
MDADAFDTPRLRLRRFRPEDAAFVLRLWNDPGYIANIRDTGLRTVADAEEYLLVTVGPGCIQKGYGLYLAELKEDGASAGFAGMFRREGYAHPDIGYAFLPEHRGNGYAWEAAETLLRHARDVLRLPGLYGFTLPTNAGSVRILTRMGMVHQRTFVMDGYPGETAQYAVVFPGGAGSSTAASDGAALPSA